MAYKKENLLRQIYYIQQYTLKMQKRGITNVRIHKNIIRVYPITIQTFYNYLNRNAKKELRALNVDFTELKKESNYISSIIPE